MGLLSVNSTSVNGLTFDETMELLAGTSSFLVFMRKDDSEPSSAAFQLPARSSSIIAGSKIRHANLDRSSIAEPVLKNDPILNAFLELDNVGAGTVSVSDIFELLKQFGLPMSSREEFDKWLLIYGLQKNERLDYRQFLKVHGAYAVKAGT